MSTAALAEKLEFKTELKQLLHIITHSLYSDRKIFLRELLSNASDAINKIKFDSLSHEDKLEGDKDWKIKLSLDREAGTLTISDNGIGMSRDTIIDQLGTIAKSGTRAFLEQLRAQNQASINLIGQFGVGFYSAFMVADRVTVYSRMAGTPPSEGVKWESDGQGEFTVEPFEKPRRGTDVVLHLKEDAREFLDTWRIRDLVKHYSNFLEHPVVMDVEKEEDGKKTTSEEVLNARAALWLRSKSECSAEEYNTFYHQICHDLGDPVRVIHYSVEGSLEYRALLFVPSRRPFEFDFGETKYGPKLYVQRVMIMDRCEELLPAWLRFIRGVVDSSDLPLNISREMLQQNPTLEKIRKDLVKTILKELSAMRDDEPEKYAEFFKELGSILKEGVNLDWSNREKVAELLLCPSLKTEPGKFTTLAKYVEAMPPEQKEIYHLVGESREQLENSPYLESFKARGWDVLLLTDPLIDAFWTSGLEEFHGKKLKAADREESADAQVEASVQEQFKGLLEQLKKVLDEVAEVRLSSRLKESAACLVAGEHGTTVAMERLMQRLNRGAPSPASKRILELNPQHPVVQSLHRLWTANRDNPKIETYARLLLDEAVLAEGSKLKDPHALARRINELIVRDAGM